MFNKVVICIALFILAGCSPKYNKKNYREAEPCFTDASKFTISKQLSLSEKDMQTKTGIYTLEDGVTSLVSRAWLCDNAQKTIDIQYYIFTRDNTGLIACD